jgi:anti-sigma factor ChrR (cupin superfamily)
MIVRNKAIDRIRSRQRVARIVERATVEFYHFAEADERSADEPVFSEQTRRCPQNNEWRHDADALQEVASFIDTAAAFAAASSPCVEPSNEQRARIFASIAATPQLDRKAAETSMPDGYSFMLNSSEGWVDTAIPGFRTKLLSRGPHPGCEVMLIALAPGAKVPDHDHAGTELHVA